MAQQTIKALYNQPITYKLIKDGYKTVTETFSARDGMPKVMELDPPAETYTTDMTYTTDSTQNCATLVTFSEFTTPDDASVPSKTYVCAPANISYECPIPTEVKTYNNFTVVGSPTVTSAGIVSGFANGNYLTFTTESTTLTSFEIQMKVKFSSNDQASGRLLNSIGGSDTVNGFFIRRENDVALVFYTGSQYYGFYALNVVENDKDYLLKWVWDGNTVKSYYSESDEDHFVLNSEVEHTSFPVAAWSYSMGVRTVDQNYTLFNGSIDLSKTYIKYNGDYIWRPYTTSTEIQTQYIPGLLDASAGNYDPTQATEYKLYQLHRGTNNDVLRLTKASLTAPNSLYNQYISQVTLPTQTPKWYYKGEPQSVDARFYNTGCSITSDHIASDFAPEAMLHLMLYGEMSSTSSLVLNIETGDMLQDCGIISYVNYYSDRSGVVLGLQNKFDGGKLLLNSVISTNFTAGVTTLQPNTKYWISILKDLSIARIYILQDNGTYTKETLPDYNSWTLEGTLPITSSEYEYGWEGTFGSLSLSGAKVYDSEGTLITSEGTFYFSGGKLYLDNTYQTYGMLPKYLDVIWQPYYYYDYRYWWCANKSIYTYLEHQDFADYLNFSDSYINVTDNTWNRYINPTVCLMSMNGGETTVNKTPGGTLVGNVTFDPSTGVLSNFSTSNYLSLPSAFSPGTNTWEFQIKFTTGELPSSTGQGLFGGIGSSDGCTPFYIHGDGSNSTLGAFLSSNGTSWDLTGTTTTVMPLAENTTYKLKAEFTGTEYNWYSWENDDWVLKYTLTSSTAVYGGLNMLIGNNRAQNNPFLGTIDLNETYIKINNQIWWQGIASTETKEHVYIYKTAGQAVNYNSFANLPSTFIDNSNFEISGSSIRNGSKSYNVNNGYSYGYFKLTPTENITVSVTASVSSESGWDYGACYIGTKLYQATREQIKAKTTDSYGSWLFSIAGTVASTTYTTTLNKDTTYYVQFYYAKDSSANNGDDRVYISALSGFVGTSSDVFESIGCIADGVIDDGTAQDWDVYYKSDFSQPVLVPTGGTYAGGTKVDTISLPAHKTWEYATGGTWTKYVDIDVSDSVYTNSDGNLVLTEYTGSEANITLPNPVL